MIEKYKVVYQGGEGEITEKKSRFIATVRPVESEEEAIAFIEELKKKYWNATHNCSAFVVGSRNEVQRCSDDGEPSGTAGRPMLDVLLGEEIHNAAVVVTRYFGGTLLGTGGLVRAYTKAVQQGLAVSTVITKRAGRKIRVRTDYQGIGKIQYILGQRGIQILDSVYEADVSLVLVLTEAQQHEVLGEITEATSGQAGYEELEAVYFSEDTGDLLLFPVDA